LGGRQGGKGAKSLKAHQGITGVEEYEPEWKGYSYAGAKKRRSSARGKGKNKKSGKKAEKHEEPTNAKRTNSPTHLDEKK